MDLDSELLRGARQYLDLSQLEAAALLSVSLVTYQRWEQGKAKPQPLHRRQIRTVFGKAFSPLGIQLEAEELSEQSSHEGNTDGFCGQDVTTQNQDPSLASNITFISPPSILKTSSEERESALFHEPEMFIATNMTTHLWSLAFMEHPTSNDKRSAIRQAIEEFDSMNTNNKNYQMTRREALYSLATLPMITFGLTTLGKEVPSVHYGKALEQCAASIEACWQLSKSSEASDLTLAFKSVTQYLPTLKTIVKESSTYTQEAASLTAQAYLLKHVLGLHVESPDVAITKGYAKLAVTYGEQSGDPLLHIAALRNLTWAYNHARSYKKALKTIEQAEHLVAFSYTSLPPISFATVYSTLAVIQAKNGLSPENALDHAEASLASYADGYSPTSSVDFSYAKLMRDTGLAHYYRGDYNQALTAFANVIDTNDLSSKVPMPARTRVELLHNQTMAALKISARDMDEVVHYWQASVDGAIHLRSQQRFDEAYMAYEVMSGIWPDEVRIKNLRDQIVHW